MLVVCYIDISHANLSIWGMFRVNCLVGPGGDDSAGEPSGVQRWAREDRASASSV